MRRTVLPLTPQFMNPTGRKVSDEFPPTSNGSSQLRESECLCTGETRKSFSGSVVGVGANIGRVELKREA
jgi:hypothetical protein